MNFEGPGPSAVYFPLHLATSESTNRILTLREPTKPARAGAECLAAAVAEDHPRRTCGAPAASCSRRCACTCAHRSPHEARRRAVVAALLRISGLLERRWTPAHRAADGRGAAATREQARPSLGGHHNCVVKPMAPHRRGPHVMTSSTRRSRVVRPCTGAGPCPWPNRPALGRRPRGLPALRQLVGADRDGKPVSYRQVTPAIRDDPGRSLASAALENATTNPPPRLGRADPQPRLLTPPLKPVLGPGAAASSRRAPGLLAESRRAAAGAVPDLPSLFLCGAAAHATRFPHPDLA